MVQLRHRGKNVYGWSVIDSNNSLCFPPEVINDYGLGYGTDLVLFTASKASGGFCISKFETLKSSGLSHIISENPELESDSGRIIGYKGKSYCRLRMSGDRLELSSQIMNHFELERGDKLLVIKGSNIAFDCIVKGPLVDMANESEKDIGVY